MRICVTCAQIPKQFIVQQSWTVLQNILNIQCLATGPRKLSAEFRSVHMHCYMSCQCQGGFISKLTDMKPASFARWERQPERDL